MRTWYNSKGTLRCDPPHGQIWGPSSSSIWWIIVECDSGICEFYRALWERRYWRRLQRPAWGSHVSVVRGEEPAKETGRRAFEALNGLEVLWYYETVIRENDEYVWLDAVFPLGLTIRELMGLDEEPEFGFHLTLGAKLPNR